MNTFPMIKTKWSNEHVMAAVFAVLILYHLPIWSEKPSEILSFVLLVAVGLITDAVASLLRYHRLWCCVSGAVTAAMISLLSSGAPLWARVAGVLIGLILGKHMMGGTGKNTLNPAMVGLFPVLMIFGLTGDLFEPSQLILPAIILGLIFLSVRPYAGTAYMLGMLLAMYIGQELTIESMLAYGVLFWGCLVITDPVTVTPQPTAGMISGLVAGFFPIFLFHTPVAAVLGVILMNLFSEDLAKVFYKQHRSAKAKIHIDRVYSEETYTSDHTFIDLTTEATVLTAAEGKTKAVTDITMLTGDEILERIKKHEVYGMGGAGFSTYRKVKTTAEAVESEKFLIINGAECDPGLIHDKWLLRNHFTEILQGAELLRSCLNLHSVYLAVKETEGLEVSDSVILSSVDNRYPIGAERLLIEEILGKKLENDRIPAQSGILVLNVQTVYAIRQAVIDNRPADTRYLTVADLMGKRATVVRARLGMKLQDILEAVYPGNLNVFAGGGIMQAYLAEEDTVLDRGINFIAAGNLPDYKESPQCSNCGTCSSVCPSGLQVKKLADLIDQGKQKEAIQLGLLECISCGSCSYSCLAGNNLTSKIKLAKKAALSEVSSS